MKLKIGLVLIICLGLITSVAQAATREKQLELAVAYSRQVIQHYQKGQFKQALPLAEKAFKFFTGMLGEKHSKTLTSLNNLASIYRELGDLQKALSLFEKGYHLSQEVLGDKHPDTLTALNNLAGIYFAVGNLKEALPLFEKGYHLRKEELGEKHPATLTSFNNLAIIHQELGRYQDALPLFKENFSLAKEELGDKHPLTLTILNNLAVTYQELGRYQDALPLHEKGYQLRTEVLGNKHPDTLINLNNLAFIYQKLGHLNKALPLFQECFNFRKEVLGDKHPDTLSSLNNLMIIYQALGHLDEALPLAENGYRFTKEILGKKHPDTLGSLNNLAEVYRKLGYFNKALPLFKQGYDLAKEVLGDKHPNTLQSLNNLAVIYQALGHLDKALPLSKKSYRFRKKVLGDKHPDTLQSQNNLAFIYNALGDLDEALLLFESGYHLLKEKLGDRHQDTLTALNNLAGIYSDLGYLDKSLFLYEKCYHLRKEVLKEKHPDTISSLNNLAQIYQKSGKLKKALSFFEKSYHLFDEVLGKQHPYTLTSLDNLAEIYRDLGHLDKALSLSKDSYDLHKNVLGEKHPSTLKSLNNQAGIEYQLGYLDKALPLYEEVYRLSKERLGEKHLLTLTSLNNLALTYAEQGMFDKGINHFETLINSVENLRRGDLSAENRQSLLEQYIKSYFALSYLYFSNNNDTAAFHLAEMAKSRTLLDSMALKLAEQQAGLTDDEQKQLQNYHRQQNAFDKLIAHEANIEKRLEFERQKNQVVKQSAEFQRILMDEYPKFKQLVNPEILTATKGAQLIPSDALFISYLLHRDNQMLAFTLDTKGDLQAYDLGRIAGLEQTLKTYRELLGEKDTVNQMRLANKYVWQLKDGSFVISHTQPQTAKKRIRKLDEISRYLGEKLLVPLKERLRRKSRWIISPDGALALIPFETLIFDDQFVIEQHSINYVQSLSALKLLKEREKEYQNTKWQGSLLAMGAARYEVPGAEIPREKCNQSKNGNPQQASDIFWCDIPYTKKELNAVKQLFPDSKIYQEAEATEAKLQSLNQAKELTRYQYLLFPVHGYFSPTNPALSALVLDQLHTTADADGYVTASEWIGYDLQSDLMVLSACETAVGKVIRGEGVMGLPYALYVAGNKNTIMTLWKVADDSTAKFTKSFFEKIKNKKMSHVEALTETKREFLQSEKYKRPRFWAPFVLYGI
jgi:CHAT domain-containing protein